MGPDETSRNRPLADETEEQLRKSREAIEEAEAAIEEARRSRERRQHNREGLVYKHEQKPERRNLPREG